MGLTYEVQRVFRKLARPKSMTPGITSRQAHRPGFLLSEPLVTLYVSAAAKTDSIHAFDMLSTVPTGFQVKASPDNSIGVEFAGQCQYGIEGVQRLKESIDQFNKVLL